MKKRIWKHLIWVLCGSVLLTGCSLGNLQSGQSDTTQESQTIKQREKQSGQISEGEHEALTICTGGINYSYFLEALHQVYPEINLKFVSYKGANVGRFMKEQLENGDVPDIFTSTYMLDADSLKENLVNLSNYAFINNYSDAVLDDVEVDGNVYLLPGGYQISGINYNKTLFETYGWEVPQSFEELVELAGQIKEDAPDVIPVVARMSDKLYPFEYLFALGSTDFLGTAEGTRWKADFLEGSAKATGSLEDCAEYLNKWIEAGFITDYDVDGSDMLSEFYEGKIAMILGTGTDKWEGTNRSTGETTEVGIMAWPGENGNHGMLLETVFRYYGISRTLEESGSEQKLSDALKVMEFISTEEGQQALAKGSTSGVVSTFDENDIGEDSPLAEVADDIVGGYTVPLVYENWVDDLLTPMADEIIELVQGDIGVSKMLAEFDRINLTIQDNPSCYDYAVLDENLTQEQTARLSGIAMMEYTDADVALVSLGGITDDGNFLENPTGVPCGVYAGNIDEDTIAMFRPNSMHLAEIELTGGEIMEMSASGRKLYADPAVLGTEYSYLSEAVTYYMPYVLVTRDDMTLSVDETYRVVMASSDYSDELAEDWGSRLSIEQTKSPADAIIAWLEALPERHFGAANLEW